MKFKKKIKEGLKLLLIVGVGVCMWIKWQNVTYINYFTSILLICQQQMFDVHFKFSLNRQTNLWNPLLRSFFSQDYFNQNEKIGAHATSHYMPKPLI